MIAFFVVIALICPIGRASPGMVIMGYHGWPTMYAVPTYCRGEA